MKLSLAGRVGVLLICCATAAQSDTDSTQQRLQKSAIDFLKQQLRHQPGHFKLRVSAPSAALQPPPCQQLEGFFPARAKLMGRTTVGLRCTASKFHWSTLLSAHISSIRTVFVVARSLRAGSSVELEALTKRLLDIAELPETVVTDSQQIEGQTLIVPLAAGTLLQTTHFRPPFAVLKNQMIRLIVQTENFRIERSAKALANRAVGEATTVQIDNHRLLQGIVTAPGVVSVVGW